MPPPFLSSFVASLAAAVALLPAGSPAVAERPEEDSAGVNAAGGRNHPERSTGWSDAGRGVAGREEAHRVRVEAAGRLAAGAPAEAIALCERVLRPPRTPLSRKDEVACRLLTAAAALDSSRYDLAEAMIRPVRGTLGPIEPWAALLLGEALAGAGRAAEAAQLLDEARVADPGGPLGDRAEPAEALALLHAGRATQAKTRLARLVAGRREDRDRLRLALAEAMLASEDRKGATTLLVSIWREAAGRAEAERARARLDELAALHPDLPAPTIDDRLFRAERLLERGESRHAEAELALAGKGGDAILRTLLLARSLSDQERKDEAEALLVPLLGEALPDHPRTDEILELAARLAMRRGGTALAVARLDRIRDRASGLRAASASFLASFFLYDDARFEAAEARFRAHLGAFPGHRSEETCWYLGWTAYKQGTFAEAARAFESLERRFPKSTLVSQARYWRARSLERSGDAKGSAALLRQIATRWPDDWYGAMARQRLGESLELPGVLPKVAASPRPKLSGNAGARLARAEALYEIGLGTEAGLELDAALSGSRDRAALAWAAGLAAAAGDPARAHRLGTLRLGGLRGAPELAYPRAYADLVEDAARRFEIEVAFVWSIMRQESGFRPQVRSPAAAVGLMQLRGITAQKLAALMGRSPQDDLRLEDPRDNITLGAYYLHALLQRFGGSFALAAAAYNAGPPAVVRWMEDPSRKTLPLDEFVESIPYRETRGYVKAVIANLIAYRSIHGGEPLRLPLALPAVSPGIDD